MWNDDEKLTKSIIKDTITRDRRFDDNKLTQAELNHAVEVANAARGNRSWKDLADVGFAAVKIRREQP